MPQIGKSAPLSADAQTCKLLLLFQRITVMFGIQIAAECCMSPSDNKRFTVWIDPKTLAELQRRAKQLRRPVGWVMRETLIHACSNPDVTALVVAAATPQVEAIATMTPAELAAFNARIAEVKEIHKK